MRRTVVCSSALWLACLAPDAGAQVHRCGESHLYTDKPCEGATAVDVRPNILDAGTRQIPADAPPAPAVIPPGSYDAPRPSGSSGSLWESRDAREAESRARTGPYRP